MADTKNTQSVMNRLNRIKPTTNFAFNAFFLIFAIICFSPILIIFLISITDVEVIAKEGYKLFPKVNEIKVEAYTYLWSQRKTIGQALFISFASTACATVLGVICNCTMGYVLSRKEFFLRDPLIYFIFIPMVFGGGMAASYIINTNLLKIGNTFWILVLPFAASSGNVILAKTFFRTTIHDSIIESCKIDGASQMQIFFKIVVPISKPVIATIGMFIAFGVWNDWFTAKLYISDWQLFSLQAMLNKMQENINYMTKNPAAGLTSADLQRQMPGEGVRMAIAFVVALPICVSYPFFQKYFITGLSVGSVKG